jgi:hypothetical protein
VRRPTAGSLGRSTFNAITQTSFQYKAVVCASAGAALEDAAQQQLAHRARVTGALKRFDLRGSGHFDDSDVEAVKPRQISLATTFAPLFQHASRKIPRPAGFRWSNKSSNGDYQAMLAEAFAREAARPTFEAFPTILLPARILVSSGSSMSRDALMLTRAPATELLQWGFAAVGSGTHGEPQAWVELLRAGAGAESAAGEGSAAILARRLLRLDDDGREKGRDRDSSWAGEQDGGARADAQRWWRLGGTLACPANIWDEPPNDAWHRLAPRVAQNVWEQHELAALSEAAAA